MQGLTEKRKLSRQKFIGIDLGGTNIKGVAIDREGSILYAKTIPSHTERGTEAVIESIVELIGHISTAIQEHGSRQCGTEKYAVGLGAAGVLDMAAGKVIWLPNLLGMKNVPIVYMIEEKIDSKVFLINDVRAMTLAEKTVGAGVGIKNLVCLAIGTGIGGGVIINNRLYFGDEGFAGELGHQVIDFNGPRCTCGNYGCLEACASAAHIVFEAIRMVKQGAPTRIRDLVQNDLNTITPKIVAQAAREGDEVALEIWDKEAFYLGVAIANLVHVLNPEMVILGGGIAKVSDILIDKVREQVCSRLHLGACTDYLKIVQCKLDDTAGAVGAALWAINQVDQRSG